MRVETFLILNLAHANSAMNILVQTSLNSKFSSLSTLTLPKVQIRDYKSRKRRALCFELIFSHSCLVIVEKHTKTYGFQSC